MTCLLYSFILVLEEKKGKEITNSLTLQSLEMFLANNFVLSDAEDKTPGPPNWSGLTDLPLFRALLAIRQKS